MFAMISPLAAIARDNSMLTFHDIIFVIFYCSLQVRIQIINIVDISLCSVVLLITVLALIIHFI